MSKQKQRKGKRREKVKNRQQQAEQKLDRAMCDIRDRMTPNEFSMFKRMLERYTASRHTLLPCHRDAWPLFPRSHPARQEEELRTDSFITPKQAREFTLSATAGRKFFFFTAYTIDVLKRNSMPLSDLIALVWAGIVPGCDIYSLNKELFTAYAFAAKWQEYITEERIREIEEELTPREIMGKRITQVLDVASSCATHSFGSTDAVPASTMLDAAYRSGNIGQLHRDVIKPVLDDIREQYSGMTYEGEPYTPVIIQEADKSTDFDAVRHSARVFRLLIANFGDNALLDGKQTDHIISRFVYLDDTFEATLVGPPFRNVIMLGNGVEVSERGGLKKLLDKADKKEKKELSELLKDRKNANIRLEPLDGRMSVAHRPDSHVVGMYGGWK